MEEAEKTANKIAVIDHGKIIAEGNAKNLMEKTKTKSLEEAFIKLTGDTIREEIVDPIDQIRMYRKVRK